MVLPMIRGRSVRGMCDAGAMAVTAPPPVVLVVEDEPAIATAVAHRLSAEGWTVEVAGDGHAGVAAARRLRVSRGDRPVQLTPTAFDLLVTLASSPRTVHTRERHLAEVWDWVDASGTRTVDSHVKALRRKLGADLVRTVHGVGYAFDPPAEVSTGAGRPAEE